jgi:hypothetical protein
MDTLRDTFSDLSEVPHHPAGHQHVVVFPGDELVPAVPLQLSELLKGVLLGHIGAGMKEVFRVGGHEVYPRSMSSTYRWGRDCPNGHGELARTVTTCHDYDDECECETIDACTTCGGYQHFATCDNAGPWNFGGDSFHDGDTWAKTDRLLRYDAGKDDWLTIATELCAGTKR